MTERVAPPRPTDPSGMRSYEVYQRLRPRDCAPVTARRLWDDAFERDPLPVLAALREHTPCFRDWIGNTFWITRYDDVTSVFVDDANFETRTRRWALGLDHRGRDLGPVVPLQQVVADHLDRCATDVAARIAAPLAARLRAGGTVDLAREVAARLPIELWARTLGLPADRTAWLAGRVLRIRRGSGWHPAHRIAARAAFDELAGAFDELLDARRSGTGDDLVTVAAALTRDDGLDERFDTGPVTGDDVAALLTEADHATLHGGLANLWALLLTHPDRMAGALADRRALTDAWLETLRHSPPVAVAHRWTRHEVERFGQLLPEGAMVTLSAVAANHDPRQFDHPECFDPDRADLCRREPRGQYRADGLPSGISFGTGAPSRFPAVPDDRPRSAYALARDTAVAVTEAVFGVLGDVGLADGEGSAPTMRTREHGDLRTCWSLPVAAR